MEQLQENMNLANKLLNLEKLKGKKCLLAFSHGVDSSALFYLLNDADVEFDCAFVNYQTRIQSDDEEKSAKELCLKFNKKIYVKKANLDLSKTSNFEKIARDLRHNFFHEIAIKFDYEILIFAHQLNDSLEWFLMQFTKGSGLVNLLGFADFEEKNIKFNEISKKIFIARPLLEISKQELTQYLEENNLKYFIDSSNFDTKFKRNYFRANFSDDLINNFQNGINKSFNFLHNDKKLLLGEFIYENEKFFILEKKENSMNLIDKALKKLGILLSEKTRGEILKGDCVISHKIAVTSNDRYYFLAPYQKTSMDKKFKEFCRVNNIPSLIRPYLYLNLDDFSALKKLLY